MIYVLCGALLCSLFANAAVGNSVLKPLRMINANLREVRDGTYKPVVPSTNDDEINNMLIDINGISEKLSETIKSSNDDRERLGYILNNFSDGIAVLDRSGKHRMIVRNRVISPPSFPKRRGAPFAHIAIRRVLPIRKQLENNVFPLPFRQKIE